MFRHIWARSCFKSVCGADMFYLFSLLCLTNGLDPGWGWKEKGHFCCLGLSVYEESDGISFSCTWEDNQSQNLSTWSWKWGKKQLQTLRTKAFPLITPLTNSKIKTGGEVQNTASHVGWYSLKRRCRSCTSVNTLKLIPADDYKPIYRYVFAICIF